MIKNKNKKQLSKIIVKIPNGMKHLFCKIHFHIFKPNLKYFSNHLHGQDTLHIDIYDKDLIFDDKIGSVKINLQDLYKKGLRKKELDFILMNI